MESWIICKQARQPFCSRRQAAENIFSSEDTYFKASVVSHVEATSSDVTTVKEQVLRFKSLVNSSVCLSATRLAPFGRRWPRELRLLALAGRKPATAPLFCLNSPSWGRPKARSGLPINSSLIGRIRNSGPQSEDICGTVVCHSEPSSSSRSTGCVYSEHNFAFQGYAVKKTETDIHK